MSENPVFDAMVPDEVLADAIGRYVCEARPDLADKRMFQRFTMTDRGLRVRFYREPPTTEGDTSTSTP